ncbi:IPT/TIG domain-containing protein [Pontibacter harenae]|uniref:IPT/TIG domain-containing protein n=1 Tax=Pontibacter harenae TaxID=2894083 RepID=UPI001E3409EA|nr:IPT/TIG domain-containing protein [Pontibacter harenae]MCC9167331.1 IPT/TIG domain-containing protein [Pontibacter harenae]
MTVLLLSTFKSFASDNLHLIPISLEERVSGAQIIVEGEVVSKKSFWDAQYKNIYTSNIIKVFKVFKGTVTTEQLEVITEGGAVGLKMHVFSTALDLRQGQQGVFFLLKEQKPQNTPANLALTTKALASQQGFVHYNIQSGAANDVFNSYSSVKDVYQTITKVTGKNFKTLQENKALSTTAVSNQQQGQLLAPIITSFSPTTASAGAGTVLTINGTGFGSSRGNGAVQFRNADKGGDGFVSPLPRDYVSWSDTQIRVRIPSASEEGGTAGSGPIVVRSSDGTTFTSVTQILIPFAYSNIGLAKRSFQPILINNDQSGGYTMQFAPTMRDRNAAREGFRRAMNSWICNTNVNWRIGAPTTIDEAADDDQNVITFASSSVTGDRVLARTISRYEGCRSGGDTLFWVSEFDMEINSSINWQYGPGAPASRQFDFETVILHELGHAHQLGHVILPRAVMHYAVEDETFYRDLSVDDIVGGNIVMANSTEPNICRQPPMVPETEGDCNLAPEIYTFTASFVNSNTVYLQWSSNNESSGVEAYVVQRSQDGTNWSDLATVSTKGPSSGILQYNYSDQDPLPRVSYYRLQVVYSNTTFRYSPQVRVLNPGDVNRLSVFPNPIRTTSQSVFFEYIVTQNTDLSFQLYDITGRLLREFSVSFSDVNVPVEVSLANLASGMYILRWTTPRDNGEIRLLKL